MAKDNTAGKEMCQKKRVTDSAWISLQHDSRRRDSGGKAESNKALIKKQLKPKYEAEGKKEAVFSF